MERVKNFFGIEKKYEFELMDLYSLITVLNVAFVIMGFAWAPVLGIVNCILNITFALKNKTHFNFYVMQISLIILNVYFLTL